jgi:hypothetical protein
MREITVLKIENIGNVIKIDDLCGVIVDAMDRCEIGSQIWTTYEAVLTVLNDISALYDNQIDIDRRKKDESVSGEEILS